MSCPEKFVYAGILKEITGRVRNRIFVYRDMINHISSPIGGWNFDFRLLLLVAKRRKKYVNLFE
jgi:hypothetical protein